MAYNLRFFYKYSLPVDNNEPQLLEIRQTVINIPKKVCYDYIWLLK